MKPRKHILVESDPGYLPFLKPLLDAPGSRYSLVDWDDTKSRFYPERYIEDGLLPNWEKLKKGDPRLDKPNDTLLILANLGYGRVKPRPGQGSIAFNRLAQFIQNIKEHEGFHSHGSVRMLVWVTDHEKNVFVPRTTTDRRKTSLEAEMVSHIEEVAGDSGESKLFREHSVELRSATRVAQRMAERGVRIPVARRSAIQQEAQDAMTRSHVDFPATSIEIYTDTKFSNRSWRNELLDLEAKFKAGNIREFEEGAMSGMRAPGDKTRPYTRVGQRTQEFLRLRALRYKRKQAAESEKALEGVLREQAAIDELDRAIADGEYEGATRTAKLEELERRTAQHMHQVNTLEKNRQYQEKHYDDDRRAFAQTPPLLMWDRRTAEPLVVQPDEFYPNDTMALLDVRPTVIPTLLTSKEQFTYLNNILTVVFRAHAQPIREHLDNLGPGAAEALLAAVPAISDIRKGGRRNVKHMRSRMLTCEMAEQLAVAWDKWPFKPPLANTISNLITSDDYSPLIKDDEGAAYI